MQEKFQKSVNFAKVDDALGLVFGWAIICKQESEDYFDLQEHTIPEETMLRAAADFMQNSRIAKDMHKGGPIGGILFAFPLTQEIAKSFDIQTKQTGLMIAMKPDNKEILEKYKDGTYTGFSIGGVIVDDESVD